MVVECCSSSIGVEGGGSGLQSQLSIPLCTCSFLLSLQLNVNAPLGSFENSGFKIDGLVLTFQFSFALSFASVFSNMSAPNTTKYLSFHISVRNQFHPSCAQRERP